jgi:recombinational DNA repair ATPase RecF
MKKPWVIILCFLLAGTAAFCVMHFKKRVGQEGVLLDKMSELAWVRSELKVTDEQLARVAELHAAYRPKCVQMCYRIAESHEKLDRLTSQNQGMSEELRTAIREHAAIHAECQETMLEHLYQTAAQLDAKQADSYLKAMLPYALDFTHCESEAAHCH